ncbi:MAG: aminoacyl-histidine dipeptidase [Clostridia bacterium]|nr:aminoacyl-histidine dipeptidase [Clostridia bacterium]
MDSLKGLQPEAVMTYFEELTKIPRGSGNEQAVSDYLVEFAKQHGLEVIQEPCNNVIIKKPGTPGYENAKTVILQGHMDIVCVKEDSLDFDFEKDPIPLVVEGDFIRTAGTTLGADNGIAIAMTMAILASKDIPHPPIIGLVTVDEEAGMGGVMALDPENISGDILINLDSEEEGVALSSCAGGVRSALRVPVETEAVPSGYKGYKLVVSGLKGGHSGAEIDKNRANAIKLLGRVLETLVTNVECRIGAMTGGDKMNAIAKYVEGQVAVQEKDLALFQKTLQDIQSVFNNEYALADPGISVTVAEAPVDSVFDLASANSVVAAMRLIPFGPQSMSEGIQGLVESSSNVGVLSTVNGHVVLESAIRSSVRTLKDEISDRISTIALLVDGQHELTASYPEWAFKPESEIRELMKVVYKETTGKELKVDAIHAGLECGFLKEKVGDIDMISIGPDMADVHTPKEHVSISSIERVYKFLLEVLKRIN